MNTKLTIDDGVAAVYGGAILGGGGGGHIEDGLKMVDKIFRYGDVELTDINELNNDDIVCNVSLIGAPSAKNQFVDTDDYKYTVEKMHELLPGKLKGLTTNENGAATTINGWLQSVLTGIPIIDAPSNGRAHPTGEMGSLNLSEIANYKSIQTYSGGKDERHIYGFLEGCLKQVSDEIREKSVQAGGMIVVCRNPVDVKYLKNNAAVGGVSHAIQLGKRFLEGENSDEKIANVIKFFEGEVVITGIVKDLTLTMNGGYDVGSFNIGNVAICFFNEYMTIDINNERVATFPDLIMTFDAISGIPVVASRIKEGQKIVIIKVDQKNIMLGSTMRNEKLLLEIEKFIDKKILL